VTRLLPWLPLVAVVMLAWAGPALAHRARPRVAAVGLTVGALAAAACTVYTLALMTLTAAGRLPWLAHRGHWSPTIIRSHSPVPLAAGLAAAGLLTVALASGLVATWRRVRALAAAERFQRRHRTLPLLVLTDPSPQAYTVGGVTGSTVAVSVGMLNLLDDRERTAMLAHEEAHARGRHHLLRLLVGTAAAINPALRRYPAALDAAVERWADDAAVAAIGDRKAVARALGRAALARSRSVDRPGAAMAFADGRDVPERVARLLAPTAPSSRLRTLGLTVLVLASITATVLASRDVEGFFEHARAQTVHAAAPLHRT
jgi:Zn-dependent protease with chaperone function